MEHNKTQEMQTIIEQSQRLGSQNCIKGNDSSGIEILVKAYDRVRELQLENQQLQNIIFQQNNKTQRMHDYEEKINQLHFFLKEKDLKIQNLQHLNQKLIIDSIKLQKEMTRIKKESVYQVGIKKQIVPVQLNSPLNMTKLDKKMDFSTKQSPEQQWQHLKSAKEYVSQQQKNLLSRNTSKYKDFQIFTFNNQTINKERYTISENNSTKQLKNCLSHHEINRMINTVNSRENLKIQNQQSKMKEYVKYCSSIEKKYKNVSPLKRDSNQQLKIQRFQHKKSPTHYFKMERNRPFTQCQKSWNETSSTHTSNPFNIFSQPRNHLNFH